MTKIGFEQKNKSRNNAGTLFRDDILVPLTGLEFFYAVFPILSNVAQTT